MENNKIEPQQPQNNNWTVLYSNLIAVNETYILGILMFGSVLLSLTSAHYMYRSSYHLTPASNRCLVYATLVALFPKSASKS